MMQSILPPNSTATERAIEAATARSAGVDVPVDRLWNPETCPASVLPWLAWALSVDDWNADWADERKREVIAASIGIHRRKGTIWSVRLALRIAGLGEAAVIENFGNRFFDGTLSHGGTETYGLPDHWAEYRVVLARPISIAQGQQARAILDSTAPARCHLKALDFVQVQNLYDAAITYDGSFSHGVT